MANNSSHLKSSTLSQANGPAQADTIRHRHQSLAQRVLYSNEFGLVVLIAIAYTTFSLILPGFSSPFNHFTMGRQIGIDAMIGFAMMVVIVTGGLDLSIGAIGVCAAMAFGWLSQRAGLPLVLSVPGALAFGAALGFLNGYTVVKSGVHSFIISLATMSLFFGAMIFLTKGEPFRELPALLPAFGKMRFATVISSLLIVTIVMSVVLAWFYHFTAAGRAMLAAGANRRAAEVSGIRTGRMIIASHALAGGLAALAALMVTARTAAAVPSMAGHVGQDWLLPAFLAPVLGGTLLAGGRVAVFGTLLGAVLVTILTSGLLQLSIGAFWIQTLLGSMLLLAVLADRGRHLLLKRRGVV